MPIDHSPVKTRNTAKGIPAKDKPGVSRTLSDSSLSVDIGPEIRAAIQASIELTLTNDIFVNKLVDLVATKVSDLVNENINKKLQRAMDEICDLTSKVDLLEKKILEQKDDCRRRDDELEQYTRRNSLRVFGVPESQGEETDTLVRDIFKKRLNVHLQPAEIDRSHRVGRAPPPDKEGKPRPRPILVKFISYQSRRQIYEKKKLLKGTSISIKEDLTAHRLDLMKKAATLHGFRNVWSVDGRIYWMNQERVKGMATWKL